MNAIDRAVDHLQELVAQVPEILQPVIQRTTVTEPESKGRQRFDRGLVRYGFPGAGLLGPFTVPTGSTAAILVGGGTSRRSVLPRQPVAIAVWTAAATIAAWAAPTSAVGT